MLTEAYQLGADGKVVEGQTILRDPQTGQLYDVVSVWSGDELVAPIDPSVLKFGPSSSERCALHGVGQRWKNDA